MSQLDTKNSVLRSPVGMAEPAGHGREVRGFSRLWILLHIAEGMSWESVRNLRYMSRCLLLVRNILIQGEVPEEVTLCLDEVNELMDETLQALSEGEINSVLV